MNTNESVMEENKKSIAYEFVNYAWKNENTDSYLRINNLMRTALNLAIEANMEFHEDDFSTILNKMSGGYWFGCNSNGKGKGESFYSNAINSRNTSAIKSYEKWVGLKPFILNNNRMHSGSKFKDEKYCYSVTGFDFEERKIYLVAYEIADRKEEGRRKLFNFNNKEWLVFRNNISLF